MNIYEQARLRYRPSRVRVVFIAEAPPENMERFFYYENVKTHDALFVNLMRALYPDCYSANIYTIRRHKRTLLERFRDDGYYLIDALPEPINLRMPSRERVSLISAREAEVAEEVLELIGNDTFNPEAPERGVVLLKATVFDALADYLLINRRLPVLNRLIKIPFPAQGHTADFIRLVCEVLAPFDEEYVKRLNRSVHQ